MENLYLNPGFNNKIIIPQGNNGPLLSESDFWKANDSTGLSYEERNFAYQFSKEILHENHNNLIAKLGHSHRDLEYSFVDNGKNYYVQDVNNNFSTKIPAQAVLKAPELQQLSELYEQHKYNLRSSSTVVGTWDNMRTLRRRNRGTMDTGVRARFRSGRSYTNVMRKRRNPKRVIQSCVKSIKSAKKRIWRRRRARQSRFIKKYRKSIFKKEIGCTMTLSKPNLQVKKYTYLMQTKSDDTCRFKKDEIQLTLGDFFSEDDLKMISMHKFIKYKYVSVKLLFNILNSQYEKNSNVNPGITGTVFPTNLHIQGSFLSNYPKIYTFPARDDISWNVTDWANLNTDAEYETFIERGPGYTIVTPMKKYTSLLRRWPYKINHWVENAYYNLKPEQIAAVTINNFWYDYLRRQGFATNNTGTSDQQNPRAISIGIVMPQFIFECCYQAGDVTVSKLDVDVVCRMKVQLKNRFTTNGITAFNKREIKTL